MNYLKIINQEFSNIRPEDTVLFPKDVDSALDFNNLLKKSLGANKTPVFTQVHIDSGELHSPNACPLFQGKGKDLVLENVGIHFGLTKCFMPPRSTIKSSTFNEPVHRNFFQRCNFSGSVFIKPVSAVDFQQATLSKVQFNDGVTDSNFINAQLSDAVFSQKISGFTCFSGANLTGTVFADVCDKTVIFIGSNLPMQPIKPKGGIQTVSDLKMALDAGEYSPDQIDKLYDVVSLAHAEVSQALITYAHVPYHINENHLDHLNQAKSILSHYCSQPIIGNSI